MTIQINTDSSVKGNDRSETYFSDELNKALSRFEDKITRLEVHFGEENGEKSGINDKRCLIEARLVNLKPIAVTDYASSTEKAFQGALDKMKRVLETTFDKLKEH